jgi:hypothetical protein
MPRVRLYLDHPDPGQVFRFQRPDGTADQIPALRVKGYIDLSPFVRSGLTATHAAYPACAIDTGAHLTIVPERVWGQFKPGAVTPLPFDSAMPQSQRVITVGGGTWPYDLVELTIRLLDRQRGVLNATVVAQLTRDGGKLAVPVVLGLRGGVIDGRFFRAEPDPAAPFGQAWLLEDP